MDVWLRESGFILAYQTGERTEYRRSLLTRTSYRFAGAFSEKLNLQKMIFYNISGIGCLIQVAQGTITISPVLSKAKCDLYLASMIIVLDLNKW